MAPTPSADRKPLADKKLLMIVAAVAILAVTAAILIMQGSNAPVDPCGDGMCMAPDESCSTCPFDCCVSDRCGDGMCLTASESCFSCPLDCGACPPGCGDDVCNAHESCLSCPADCGNCPYGPPGCGDYVCNGTEDCSSCPADCGDCPQINDLEVHEWGVMAGCAHNASYFATSRPEISMMVKQPVVYVHSEGIDKFQASFVFAQGGRPTDTYPEAMVSEGVVSWRGVKIVDDCSAPLTRGASKAFVPLEQLIPTLSDVDSDCLSYGGAKTRFLFYEGEIPFVNKVDVALGQTKPANRVTVKNNGDTPVYNVIYSTHTGDFINGRYTNVLIGDLQPGEGKTANFEELSTAGLLKNDLVSIGFTESEAAAFEKIWAGPFFQKTNTYYQNLIYRLPQSEYNRMIPASFVPQPKKTVRAMYVQVDLGEPQYAPV